MWEKNPVYSGQVCIYTKYYKYTSKTYLYIL